PALAEVVEPADAIGRPVFIVERVAQWPAFPTRGGPLLPDQAINRVRVGRRRPIDRATLAEVVEAADAVRCPVLVVRRVAEHAALPAECMVFVSNAALQQVRAGVRGL